MAEKLRIYEEQLTLLTGKARLELTDSDKRRLARKGKELNDFLLATIEPTWAPGTIRKWYSDLVEAKYNSVNEGQKKRGRKPISPEIVEKVLHKEQLFWIFLVIWLPLFSAWWQVGSRRCFLDQDGCPSGRRMRGTAMDKMRSCCRSFKKDSPALKSCKRLFQFRTHIPVEIPYVAEKFPIEAFRTATGHVRPCCSMKACNSFQRTQKTDSTWIIKPDDSIRIP